MVIDWSLNRKVPPLHVIFALPDFPNVIKSEEVCPYILETLITGVVEQAVEKKQSKVFKHKSEM